jgi:hypothetical protein
LATASTGATHCNTEIVAVLDERREPRKPGLSPNGTMALTLDRVSVSEGREPSGFAAFTGRSPDGSRRSANKVSAIWLSHNGQSIAYVEVSHAYIGTKV